MYERGPATATCMDLGQRQPLVWTWASDSHLYGLGPATVTCMDVGQRQPLASTWLVTFILSGHVSLVRQSNSVAKRKVCFNSMFAYIINVSN